jgi:hypothetical protein
MTTIKPFYIKITSDITKQQIQDALDKCVSLGADAIDRPAETETTIEYLNTLYQKYSYFGVRVQGSRSLPSTCLGACCDEFRTEAIEITLDQLDEHLGIKPEPKEPKFKYVEVEGSIFDLKAEFEAGELYYERATGKYILIDKEIVFSRNFTRKNIYRRVELTEEEELTEVIHSIIVDCKTISSKGAIARRIAESGKLKLA